MNPPPISMDTLSSDLDVIFKQLTIYIIMGFIIGLAVALLGKVAGLIAGMLALLLLPAMVILLVSTKRLIQAMNPGAFITLPMRIGGGYLAMYFFLVLLGGGPTVIFNLTKGMLPMAVLPFLIAFFQNYYTLMFYNLMGYVLLQYHEEIGYEVNYEDFHCQGGPPKRLRPSSPLLTEVEVHIKDGNFGWAMDLLETEIKVKESRNLDLHERYYNLLKLQNLKEKWHEQAMEYIDLLVEADNREKACQVYLECSASDAGFAPSAKGLIRLGGWLKACGQAREAIRAYAAFNREYNKDPRVPLVCFRAAEIFNETFGQKTKARGLLQGIVNTYPDHDIVPSVRNYMSRIRG
ncbi:MAG: hypothetical protein MI802_22990 [Desulfobacterales bacterium]|nr:hypothetical protein [Desulfobacterales bacterium]